MKVTLTRHAVERGRERLGLGLVQLQRQAQKAWDCGLQNVDTRGELMRWLEDNQRRHGKGNASRIHGEHVYVFEVATLITILVLPQQFKRAVRKMLSRRPRP